MNLFNFGLYPVITKEFCLGRDVREVLKYVLEGGAGIIQLREKNLSKCEFKELALYFRKETRKYGVTLIINDYPSIALETKADGVHLGQSDMPCEEARKMAPDLIIGVSTHNQEEILKAEKDGASYINIGPIFSTQTKTLQIKPLGLQYLKRAKTRLPFSVMGGIKEKHIIELISLNVKNIAMVTEITEADDITGKVKELMTYFNTGNQ